MHMNLESTLQEKGCTCHHSGLASGPEEKMQELGVQRDGGNIQTHGSEQKATCKEDIRGKACIDCVRAKFTYHPARQVKHRSLAARKAARCTHLRLSYGR